MKNVLMLVRIPYDIAVQFAVSPSLAAQFDFVYVTVDDPPPKHTPFVETHVHGNVNAVPRDRVREFIRGVIRGAGVTHALVCQPLLWYSEEVRAACGAEGVKLTWTEVFLDGKMIFDDRGCQYTKNSDLVQFAHRAKFAFPEEPRSTRAEQPPDASPAEIYETYKVTRDNAAVLFGQSHIDMAIVDSSGRLGYLDWVDILIRNNPHTKFLYKPHPIYRDKSLIDPVQELINERSSVGHPFAVKFNNSIFSAFDAFKYFAAYSSTVILEGSFRGHIFVTGGRHFLDNDLFCRRIETPDDAPSAFIRCLKQEVPYHELIAYLGFITRCYSMRPDDPRLTSRLLLSSEEFYGPYLQ